MNNNFKKLTKKKYIPENKYYKDIINKGRTESDHQPKFTRAFSAVGNNEEVLDAT